MRSLFFLFLCIVTAFLMTAVTAVAADSPACPDQSSCITTIEVPTTAVVVETEHHATARRSVGRRVVKVINPFDGYDTNYGKASAAARRSDGPCRKAVTVIAKIKDVRPLRSVPKIIIKIKPVRGVVQGVRLLRLRDRGLCHE